MVQKKKLTIATDSQSLQTHAQTQPYTATQPEIVTNQVITLHTDEVTTPTTSLCE